MSDDCRPPVALAFSIALMQPALFLTAGAQLAPTRICSRAYFCLVSAACGQAASAFASAVLHCPLFSAVLAAW